VATIVRVANREEGILALESGTVDGFASERFLLGSIQSGTALSMLPEDLSVEPYAIVLPRGDWAFRVAVNTALAQVYRSSEILDIFTHWFGGAGLRPNLLIGAVYVLGALPVKSLCCASFSPQLSASAHWSIRTIQAARPGRGMSRQRLLSSVCKSMSLTRATAVRSGAPSRGSSKTEPTHSNRP
jgi:hypothetical protein